VTYGGGAGDETPREARPISALPDARPVAPRARRRPPWIALIVALVWAIAATVVAVVVFAGRGDLGDEADRLREQLAIQRGRLEVKTEQLQETENEAARVAAEMEECREASRASQQALGLWGELVRAEPGVQEVRAFFRLQSFRREWNRTARACLGEGAQVFSWGSES
jgi:hypothetical protein